MDTIDLTYDDKSPFIDLKLKLLKKPNRRILLKYAELMDILDELPDLLSAFIPRLKELAEEVKFFPS